VRWRIGHRSISRFARPRLLVSCSSGASSTLLLAGFGPRVALPISSMLVRQGARPDSRSDRSPRHSALAVCFPPGFGAQLPPFVLFLLQCFNFCRLFLSQVEIVKEDFFSRSLLLVQPVLFSIRRVEGLSFLFLVALLLRFFRHAYQIFGKMSVRY
jgi:hypothetical protein